ncbi:MAG TPA: cbb3-type cytochrome oxidase assembly protein CcoS [Oligoflexus sp.]|uniref:cbb3-type cytochrome oxidase assembly protein CcoS n=1 Tax=Oligoflexus sp. TaxID=1971216 RepID=UPI002D633FB5|nr:cbb3-type cytochrome oxidase assembly protein CcoS [Oligoflexus sp.]HYX31962.1 cbb3-type cytochrome oxidase assembly protein CcoS [Oligoflexus sp.]
MEVLYVLITLSFAMAGTGLLAFLWANASGQFRDLKSPAEKILFDEQDNHRS